MKKSNATRDLVNIYPPETRVRHEQSVGFTFLNAFGKTLEYMDRSLIRSKHNQYLLTANLNEIDLLYKVTLPTTFSFTVDTSDPAVDQEIAPTVSGYIDGSWLSVTQASLNSLEELWYNSLPSRVTLGDSITNIDYELLSFTASGVGIEGDWEHHLDDGGWLWVTASGGSQYLRVEDANLYRGRVTVRGTTKRGQEDAETLVFPWDMTQHTEKEWKTIEKIEAHDIEDDVILTVKSANFNATDRIDFWNTAYSDMRRKIDEFWGLGWASEGSSLERIRYITDEWEQLILGMTDKYVEEAWELLDSNYNPVSLVDMVIQPFTSRAWAISSSGQLYCYEAEADMVSGISFLRDRTPGSYVRIDIEPRWVLYGEDIVFLPWHARALQEINRYRVWYQTPGGVKYGLLNGSPVAWSSDFWVTGGELGREIEGEITISAGERGEYLLALEVDLDDGTTHKDRVIVSVNYKLPVCSIDISDIISNPILGMDFDSNQKLWIKTSDTFYQLDFHTDQMLVDYKNKIIYFKEPYTQVSINND